MDTLLRMSYAAFRREFPERAAVAAISTQTLVYASVFLFLIGLTALLLDPQFETWGLVLAFALYVPSLLLGVTISRWFLNRYATDPFSWKDVLALQYVFFAFPAIIFSILDTLGTLGDPAAFATGIMGLVIGIYMLFTWQKGLARIAGITLNEATLVIFSPFFVFLGVFIVFIAVAMIAGAIVG
jgi:hypothetical protein